MGLGGYRRNELSLVSHHNKCPQRVYSNSIFCIVTPYSQTDLHKELPLNGVALFLINPIKNFSHPGPPLHKKLFPLIYPPYIPQHPAPTTNPTHPHPLLTNKPFDLLPSSLIHQRSRP